MNMRDRSLDTQEARQTAYNVELHIDEIVLHGFAHRDRYTIQEAIQDELTRLIASSGIPSSLHGGNEAARLDAGTVTVQKGMPPDAIGRQVAHAVYQGLGQQKRQPARSEQNRGSAKQ